MTSSWSWWKSGTNPCMITLPNISLAITRICSGHGEEGGGSAKSSCTAFSGTNYTVRMIYSLQASWLTKKSYTRWGHNEYSSLRYRADIEEQSSSGACLYHNQLRLSASIHQRSTAFRHSGIVSPGLRQEERATHTWAASWIVCENSKCPSNEINWSKRFPLWIETFPYYYYHGNMAPNKQLKRKREERTSIVDYTRTMNFELSGWVVKAVLLVDDWWLACCNYAE